MSDNPATSTSPGKPKLLDRVRAAIRVRHYSLRTEQAYTDWIRRFIVFHGRRHPEELGAQEIGDFLNDLAVRGQVAASTQNQALSALLFLYREVLKVQLPWVSEFTPAKRPVRVPVVLTREEVTRLLGEMEGTMKLIAQLLYGGGLRLARSPAAACPVRRRLDGGPPAADEGSRFRLPADRGAGWEGSEGPSDDPARDGAAGLVTSSGTGAALARG